MKSLFKLTPICVIAGLMLSGMDILLAAPLSFLYSVFVAMNGENLLALGDVCTIALWFGRVA